MKRTKPTKRTPLSDLPNLGPKSRLWLEKVGIRTRGDLQKLGAAGAWKRVFEAGFNPSLNLLWALEAALREEHWTELPSDVKKRLRAAIE